MKDAYKVRVEFDDLGGGGRDNILMDLKGTG
jgi:hypothetical protein